MKSRHSDGIRRSIMLYTLPLTATLVAALAYVSATRGMSGIDGDYEKASLFTLVHSRIVDNYLEEVDGQELFYAGLKQMAELDRYSTFLTPEESRRFDETTHRHYYGVGFSVRQGAPRITIDYLFENSPAERAGLMPGDRVIAIEGKPIENFKAGEETTTIKGKEGTKVTLTIRSPDGSERDVSLARADIIRPTVFRDHYRDPEHKIGYLRIDSFGNNTVDQFKEELAEQQAEGITSLVLDLRFNEGGVVDGCRSIANLFINKGSIVAIRYRDESRNVTHGADPEQCLVPDMPMVVLVNRYTASAAEIVAGALQDHQRGLLVGERTFGKGVVQSIFPLPLDDEEGNSAILKITTGEYLTPAGRAIDNSVKRQSEVLGGLQPDIVKRLDKETISQLSERFRFLEISSKYRDAHIEALGRPLPEVEDRQLQAALEVLRGNTVAQDL